MRFRPILLAILVVSHSAAAGAQKPGKSTLPGERGAALKPARFETKSPLARRSATRTIQRIRPLGEISLIGYRQAWEGKVLTPKGRIIPSAREAISRVLGAVGSRPEVPERLIHLLVQTSDAFGGRPLRVVCGYRTTSYSPDSRHRHSAAVDFSIIGVRNADVRDYLLTLDDVGVGYYPNSSFVHFDVRKEKTYWIDYSGPGQPPRYTPRKALAASERPQQTPVGSAQHQPADSSPTVSDKQAPELVGIADSSPIVSDRQAPELVGIAVATAGNSTPPLAEQQTGSASVADDSSAGASD